MRAKTPMRELWYRTLSLDFSVRSDISEVLDEAARVLAPFRAERSRSAATFVIRQAAPSVAFEVSFEGTVAHRARSPQAAADWVAWKASLESIGRAEEHLVLHSGAIAWAGRGVVLPAPPDSGKTTLTAALTRAGFAYLSDEAAFLERGTGRLLPFPRALSMEEPSLDAIHGLRAEVGSGLLPGRQLHHVTAHELRPDAVGRACQVRYVVAPSYVGGTDVTLERMSRAEGVVLLAENSFNLKRFGAEGVRLLAEGPERCRVLPPEHGRPRRGCAGGVPAGREGVLMVQEMPTVPSVPMTRERAETALAQARRSRCHSARGAAPRRPDPRRRCHREPGGGHRQARGGRAGAAPAALVGT